MEPSSILSTLPLSNTVSMSESLNDQLKLVASATINVIFSTGKIYAPISSMDLLSRVISSGPPPGLLPIETPPPRFRLIDLPKFESILEDLSQSWDYGAISLRRDDGVLTVMDVHLGSQVSGSALAALTRKRKRVVDEDADSAAGNDPDEQDSFDAPMSPGSSTLGNLSKEMKEVYTILQMGTAKGRLLAEQVCIPFHAWNVIKSVISQYQSFNSNFEPICAQITKEECTESRLSSSPPSSSTTISLPPVCDRIHFRPLIRPHTDPALGHCSYLNTCYSEPTYAQSPSIPPFPSNNTRQGAASLPSGLGAGGRGKEKAPCRYLHYEVDWDEKDGVVNGEKGKEKEKVKKPYRIGIGMGPYGKNMQVASNLTIRVRHWIEHYRSYLHNG